MRKKNLTVIDFWPPSTAVTSDAYHCRYIFFHELLFSHFIFFFFPSLQRSPLFLRLCMCNKKICKEINLNHYMNKMDKLYNYTLIFCHIIKLRVLMLNTLKMLSQRVNSRLVCCREENYVYAPLLITT